MATVVGGSVCACVHACEPACVMCLIMIIIKIIFLYSIEIAHTDDFPSTGTRLVHVNCLHVFKTDYIIDCLHSDIFTNNNNNNNKSIYIAPNQSRLLSGALHNMAN